MLKVVPRSARQSEQQTKKTCNRGMARHGMHVNTCKARLRIRQSARRAMLQNRINLCHRVVHHRNELGHPRFFIIRHLQNEKQCLECCWRGCSDWRSLLVRVGCCVLRVAGQTHGAGCISRVAGQTQGAGCVLQVAGQTHTDGLW